MASIVGRSGDGRDASLTGLVTPSTALIAPNGEPSTHTQGRQNTITLMELYVYGPFGGCLLYVSNTTYSFSSLNKVVLHSKKTMGEVSKGTCRN